MSEEREVKDEKRGGGEAVVKEDEKGGEEGEKRMG
jgi:hypothetical protein